MRDHLSFRAVATPRSPSLPAALAALALLGCSAEAPAPEGGSAAAPAGSPEAAARLDALRARFPGVLDAAAAPSAQLARVDLPPRADGAVSVADEASGLAIAFSLEGAAPAPIAAGAGLALYAGAGPEGGDVVLRAHRGGAEDFVVFERAPARAALRYRVDVTGAAGLRLVERTLEFLDRDGAPRLRVPPPWLADATGARRPVALAVEGCAVDTSPAAPWGRPVTPPGAGTCTVVAAWDQAAVSYPAIVDPQWVSTTNTMIVPRTQHAATELSPGYSASRVLITGGFASETGAALASAEIYEPLSRTFSITDAMTDARGAHTSTLLAPLVPTTTPAPVLVAGGSQTGGAGGAPIGSLEIYNPATGFFVTDPNVITPRFRHTATAIGDRTVLIAGGTAIPLNQPTNSANIYHLNGFNGAVPDSTLDTPVDPPNMTASRTGHAAVRLLTGNVLITGGFVLSGTALPSGELYDPVANTFSATTATGAASANMSVLRGFHAATLLSSGQVLITGGTNVSSGGTYTNTFDIYHDGVQSPAIRGFEPQTVTMAGPRANHTATLLPTGQVVVAGGFDGSVSLASAELFDPATDTFGPVGIIDASVMDARRNHVAVLVNAGKSESAGRAVLVAGGSNAIGVASASAQLLLKDLGEACSLASECLSGFCAEGVCCNEECTEECYACRASTKQSGTGDGICDPALAGTLLPVVCINEIEVHNECDGAGTAIPNSETKDCKPGTCGVDDRCITYCFTDDDCSATGWCDLSDPVGQGGGGGAGGAGGSAGGGGTGGAPPEGAGQCKDRFAIGTTCERDRQCELAGQPEGFCVDGFCCDLQCDGQCLACDLQDFEGKCQPVGSPDAPEAPHPNTGGEFTRDACPGDGACAGYCVGAGAACGFPSVDDTLQDPVCACPGGDPCTGPATVTRFPCDGAGSYSEVSERCGGDEGGFECESASACRSACTTDVDCIEDFICQDGTCVDLHVVGPLCDGDRTLRIAEADDQDCSPYACPDGAQACPTRCASVNDCVGGTVCNAAGECVTQLEAPEVASCSCRVAGAPERRPAWPLALAAAALAAVAARRRRTRSWR